MLEKLILQKEMMNSILYKSIFLIRFIPGFVFFLEGIQKFLYEDTLGVGRFIKIGIPHAEFWALFVGIVEIVFGALLILGFKTRWSSIPLLIDMMVAFIYTKWPLLIQKGFLPMFHDYRTDFAMTLCLIFLIINGSGAFSLDSYLLKNKEKQKTK
jgi:uncharacterized membrane protein YphA (DoxX/SURF4 family)